MNFLFICNQNQNRSPTAENLFKDIKKHEAKSAGLFCFCGTGNLLSKEMVKWSDIIFVMENRHIGIISRRFPEQVSDKRIVNLGIPDIYDYMQPELVELLKERLRRYSSGLGV